MIVKKITSYKIGDPWVVVGRFINNINYYDSDN